MELDYVWKKTLAQIEVKLDSPPHFKTWFAPTELVQLEGKQATIGVRNSYASDWLKKKHLDLIETTLSHVVKKELKVAFVISKNLANVSIEKVTKEEREQTPTPIFNVSSYGQNQDFDVVVENSNLNPLFNLSNFVVGPSNRLAHAASLAVIENPGSAYNPLFVYGETGLGKTHLAQGIGIKLLEKKQSRKILYTPSENFLNELVAGIKTGRAKEFRNKYRFLDLLVIDDIQLISKWEQTQDELFNTFNALQNKNKQVILVSDRPPEEIHNLEARLLSRFQGGMVVQVEKPDFETRLAILTSKARELNLELSTEIIEFIASNVDDNIRRLTGCMQQIALFNRIHSHEITIDEVANILGTDARSKQAKITPKAIVKAVAKEFQVTTKDIMSKSRKADIALARQVAMYLLRAKYEYKLEDIAKQLNKKDHTTVIHAVDKIESKLKVEKGFEDQLNNVVNNLG